MQAEVHQELQAAGYMPTPDQPETREINYAGNDLKLITGNLNNSNKAALVKMQSISNSSIQLQRLNAHVALTT